MTTRATTRRRARDDKGEESVTLVPKKQRVQKDAAEGNSEANASASTTVAHGHDSLYTEPPHRYWLMKSEPDVRLEKGVDISCSIQKLQSLENKRVAWYGVRNYQARNFMRDDMRVGDLAFFYHSNCKEPGIAGVVRICRASYPDFTQFDAKHPYYDPKATEASPRWHMVDVEFVRELPRFVPLSLMKEHAGGALKSMALLQRSRLSVQPVSADEWKFILGLAGM